jgi:hypothetical protein
MSPDVARLPAHFDNAQCANSLISGETSYSVAAALPTEKLHVASFNGVL